jgi:hypothetical protein
MPQSSPRELPAMTLNTAMPIYDWQRFWVPRTGTIDLSDGGFLADPSNLIQRFSATAPRPLTQLTGYRALVLLGEPGIGKSTTLLEEAERVSNQAVGENTIAIHVDLRAYSRVQSSRRGRKETPTSSFIWTAWMKRFSASIVLPASLRTCCLDTKPLGCPCGSPAAQRFGQQERWRRR